MNLQNILSIIFLSWALISCDQAEKNITNSKDYEKFLATAKSEIGKSTKKEKEFWSEKLEKAPNQFPYLGKIAGANAQLFSATGDIAFLKKAEQNLLTANKKMNYDNAGYLRALARNYISQHRFKEALILLEKAKANGEKSGLTRKMLFDVHLELGNYRQAEKQLAEIKNLNDFGYLIRLSKWSDHKGNLEAAIKYMEKAKSIAESSKNDQLISWSYTNLGDFYGHANRIADSYNMYLRALEIDAHNAYAKKGIAWIVYSYERNPKEALRILNHITDTHNDPSYILLKAEIAEYLNNDEQKETFTTAYIQAVKDENYGEMYNKYNALLMAESPHTVATATKIAQREIKNRPTPGSYDLLAWATYKSGDENAAMAIVNEHVLGKTYEPEALYHAAAILKANGMGKDAMKLKEELLQSTYELGPVLEENIKNL